MKKNRIFLKTIREYIEDVLDGYVADKRFKEPGMTPADEVYRELGIKSIGSFHIKKQILHKHET